MDAKPDLAMLSGELTVSPPPESTSQRQPPKSPPLAFAPTSNDSLAPLISSPRSRQLFGSFASPPSAPSGLSTMSPQPNGDELDLQAVVHQQANAMQLSHEAFAAERLAWSLERERLYQRIGSLEKLLRNGDHYSPAKSPILSPTGGSITSSKPRTASNASRLPMIEEDDDSMQSLAARRDGAPLSIDLPGKPAVPNLRVSLSNAHNSKIDEVPISPPSTTAVLSPLPAHNVSMAGHTPLKAPRVPTPPPRNMLDGIDDTPTRNNTHINTLLTQSETGEEAEVLQGPLNLPELPNKPDETNFTFEALSKRLEQIEHDPEDAGRPAVLSRPITGLASPAELTTESQCREDLAETRNRLSDDRAGSNVISPFTTLSPRAGLDEDIQQRFESGGIKLKKKPSTNFGAPFGSLGGFDAMRKLS